MAKLLENALVCDVIERDSKDGKFKNVTVRLYEEGTYYPEIVEMKIKPEEIVKWKQMKHRQITNVILDEFKRKGVSAAGKPYDFTDYILKSFNPAKAMQAAV